MKQLVILLSLAITLWTSSSAQPNNFNCFSNPQNTPELRQLLKNINNNVDEFSLSLFRSMAASSPNSVFMSPYGIWSALGLAFLGSEGHTKNELAGSLGLSTNKDESNTAMRHLKAGLKRKSSTGATLKTVDKAYFAQDMNVAQCILKAIPDVETINFDQTKQAADTINGLVNSVTEGNIKKIVEQSDMVQARFVLLNAIYFKGDWVQKFDPARTRRVYFTDENVTRNISIVTLMVQEKKELGYTLSNELGAHIVELPYEGGDISMYAMLPETGVSTTDTILQNLNSQNVNIALGRIRNMPVDIAFPRFKMSTEYSDDLKQVLGSLGITSLFQPGADLTGFTTAEALHADTIIHKAKLEVNEEGTTAAAATAIIATRVGTTRPVRLIFNKPFVFLIRDKTNGVTLFAGRFNTPDDTQSI